MIKCSNELFYYSTLYDTDECSFKFGITCYVILLYEVIPNILKRYRLTNLCSISWSRAIILK